MTPPQLETIAELSTNLAAGWLGTILIAPGFTGIPTLPELGLLLFRNIPPATLAIFAAIKLREEVKV